jgi:acyl-CoA thioesterase FadM
MRFGDPMAVDIVGVKIDRADVNIGYRIARPGGEVAAVGQTLHVWVDVASFKRVPALPDDVLAAHAPLVFHP